MPIKVLFNDLRVLPIRLERRIVDWSPGMNADEAVRKAFPLPVAETIIGDLIRNNREIGVYWFNDILDERNEPGGVGSLDWEIPDKSVLIITYEDTTTSQDAENEVIAWMREDEAIPWY